MACDNEEVIVPFLVEVHTWFWIKLEIKFLIIYHTCKD